MKKVSFIPAPLLYLCGKYCLYRALKATQGKDIDLERVARATMKKINRWTPKWTQLIIELIDGEDIPEDLFNKVKEIIIKKYYQYEYQGTQEN